MRAKEFISEQREKFDLDELSRNPNVRVMLDLIARAEGNTDYNTLVGGGKFKDFSSHPNKTVYLRSRDKAGNVKIIPSDAAGRYQIMGFNWQPYAKRLGLKDFSPASQDKIAIQMLIDRGAMNAILNGDFKNAVKKTGSQWVSLPSTEIKQGYGPKSWKWVNNNIAELSQQYGVEGSTQVAQIDKSQPSVVDKIRDVAGKVIGGATTTKTASAEKQPANNLQPGYYTVGDSHAQGVGGYSGKGWTNFGQHGLSALKKDDMKKYLQDIKNIPAGSVVTISLGANDLARNSKISDIVDQVNKTIAASKAQGHQVVYLLPTASTNPKFQQKREELRQALLQSLESRNILDLGVAPTSKEIKGADDIHLGREGYKKYGTAIKQMFTPGTKPVEPKQDQPSEHPLGTYVKPDWSKYEFGDLGTLEKIGPGKWRSDKGKIITNAPELEKLIAEPKPETYLDKIKNLLPSMTGAKNTAQATTKPSTEPTATTKTPTDVDIDFDVKPVSSPKSTNKTATNVDVDLVKPSSSPKSTTKTPTDADIDFDTKSSSTPTKIDTEPKVDIRKDFERAFSKARKEQGAGGKFDWTDPKTGKTSSYTTDYESEKATP